MPPNWLSFSPTRSCEQADVLILNNLMRDIMALVIEQGEQIGEWLSVLCIGLHVRIHICLCVSDTYTHTTHTHARAHTHTHTLQWLYILNYNIIFATDTIEQHVEYTQQKTTAGRKKLAQAKALQVSNYRHKWTTYHYSPSSKAIVNYVAVSSVYSSSYY